MRRGHHASPAEKLTCYESSVRRCIVIVKHPLALASQFRPFPPNVLPQTPQNIAGEIAVEGLTPGDEFTVNNLANVEENDEHAVGSVVDTSCLLRSWRCCALPLRSLLVGLRVVPVDPCLVPSDDPLDMKVGSSRAR